MKTGLAYLAAVVPLAMAESLCDQYAYLSKDGYNFNNNEWGAATGTGDQCTYVDSTSSSGVSWHADWTWSGSETEIKSYPYSGLDLPEKKIVTSIGSISTEADWSYEGSNIRADVAYDIFTAADPNHATSSGDYEVMIWLGNLGGLTPIGSPVGTVKAAGRDWELWDGYNGPMRVYSFVAPSQLNSFDGEIMDFFYVVKDMRDFPADSQHLLTVQFGTEPISGSNAKFSVSHWSAKLQ